MAGMDLAYWISPQGKVLEPTMYHIGSIVSNPKKFGETDKSIMNSFEKHGEPVSRNSEGEARNEIIERVMKRDFIRIRKHNSRVMQKWVVELYNMSNKKAVYISNWARMMIKKKLTDDIYADVKITDLRNFKGVEKPLETMAKLFKESVSIRVSEERVIWECSLEDLAQPDVEIDMEFGKESDMLDLWEDINIRNWNASRLIRFIKENP